MPVKKLPVLSLALLILIVSTTTLSAQSPDVDIEKATNGQDADSAPGPIIVVGDLVNWTYLVTNTSPRELVNIIVTDDQGVIVTCPTTILDAGENMTCTASGTAVAGQYANIGTVTAELPNSDPVSDSDPSHYFGQAAQDAVSIVKATNGEDANTPPGPTIPAGDPVNWTYIITNTGADPLTGITVGDDQGVTVSCPATTLGMGENMTCTASGTAVAGPYTNVGMVMADLPDESTVTDSDPSHYFGLAASSIDIEKATNGQDADSPTGPLIPVGDPVNWTYVVTNTGDALLTDIIVTDDQGVIVTCPPTPGRPDIALAAGESTTCTASGTASAGQYANLGTAIGTPSGGGAPVSDSDLSHYLGVLPGIDIQKATNGVDADSAPGPFIEVGDPVNWTYVVTNISDAPLSNVSVTDDQSVTVSCPKTTLTVGESMTCTASGTAVAGQYTNLGTATGQLPNSDLVLDDDPSHYFGTQAGLSIEKSTNGFDADSAPGPSILVGDPVNWTYIVTNTGADPLSEIAVTDDQSVTVTCPQDALAPTESMTCTASGTATIGQYANLGTVTGVGPGEDIIGNSDSSHYFGVNPAIDIEKSTNGQDADDPPGPTVLAGSIVTWTYVVTNTGNVPLNPVTVTDDQGVTVSCPATTLAAGASMTCTASGTAQTGQYSNTGTATGTPPGELELEDVTDSDLSHYFGVNPAIDIEKATNGEDVDTAPGPSIAVGEPVNWTYMVTNSGDVALTNITVADDQSVIVTCPQATLAPSESMTCTASGIAAAGQYGNTGTASGTPPGGLSAVSDTDDSHYFGVGPGIDIEKATNGEDAHDPPGPSILRGDPVNWTYVVTNTGNVPLTDVTVSDDQGVTVTCPGTTLAPSESMTCAASGTAEVGQYTNIGTATGTPPTPFAAVSDSDTSHYLGVGLGIDIEKATNGEDADSPPGPSIPVGDPVNWTYIVTNNTGEPLTNVTVTDDQGVTVSCPQETLAIDESMTCTASGAAIDGQYTNVGMVTALLPNSESVSDADASHYVGFSGLAIQKAFDDAMLDVDEETTLVFTLINSANSPALTNLSFSDDLPDGLEYVGPVDATQCGGTVTLADEDRLSFSGGQLPAGPSDCAIEVVVVATGDETGVLTNITSILTAAEGLNSPNGATATIEVLAPDEEDDEDEPAPAPSQPGPAVETFLCDNLAARTNSAMTAQGTVGNIVQNGVTGNTYCRIIAVDGDYRTSSAEIGDLSLIQMDVVQAVDMFGLLPGGVPATQFTSPVRLCLRGTGNVYFISAVDNTVQLLPAAQNGGYLCVDLWTAGKVVLVGTPNPGATVPQSPAPGSGQAEPVTGCEVTTTNMVRLRQTPDTSSSANIITTLPFSTVLEATEYLSGNPGWYRVIYSSPGWVREDFLNTSSGCPS